MTIIGDGRVVPDGTGERQVTHVYRPVFLHLDETVLEQLIVWKCRILSVIVADGRSEINALIGHQQSQDIVEFRSFGGHRRPGWPSNNA